MLSPLTQTVRFSLVLLFSVVLFSETASARSNQIISRDCESVAVRIAYPPDVNRFFDALPESSEQIEDSGVRRSFKGASSRDRLSLTCVLSSEERGACTLSYERSSFPSDTCVRSVCIHPHRGAQPYLHRSRSFLRGARRVSFFGHS